MPNVMDKSLYRLLAWLSPAYPIGAFSYSHGVETAVEEGFIKDRVSLVAWLETVLRDGTGRVDGALFAAAWRAADTRDWPTLQTRSPSARRPGAARRRWRWSRASRAARSCRSRATPGRIPISTRARGVADRAAGRRGAGRRGARHRAGDGARRLSPRLHRQPHLGGGADRAARPKRRAIGAGGA